MPKRKIHIDGPQPRGVTQAPHARRAKGPSAATKRKLAAMRQDADEAAVSLRQNLDSSATLAIGRPTAPSVPFLLSGSSGNLLVDLLQPDVGNAVVVLPNTSVSTMGLALKPLSEPSSDAACRGPSETSSTTPLLHEAAVYAQALMKINVSVAAVLAEKRLPLGRVLNITPGTILRFGKPCDQPLELEVGGRRIATGEAVTFDEQFGFRITSILK